MGKKNKNKKKKVNPKRERYAKFAKEKPSSIMTFTLPDLTPEQQRQSQEDDRNIGLFWRYNKRRPVSKGIGAKSRQ